MATPGRAPSAPSLAASLLRNIGRMHVRAQRRELDINSASLTTSTILTTLDRTTPITLAELSRRLRLDKGWISRAVEQLAGEGIIKKVAGKGDRRTVQLALTATGLAHRTKIDGLLDAQMARVLAHVPRAQRAQVFSAVRLLHDAYQLELGEPEPTAE